jgi:upstream activation factor subunit UAF30
MTTKSSKAITTQENKTSTKDVKVKEVKEVKEAKEVKKRTPKAKESEAKEPAPAATEAPAKKAAAKKTSKKASAAAASAAATDDESAVIAPASDQEEAVQPRRELTRESLEEYFDGLLAKVLQETEAMKNGGDKRNHCKFLKQVSKDLKVLKNNSLKLSKKKKKQDNGLGQKPVSGFMKPVPISKEMTSFAGWGKDELKSRVDVTKSICEYIKTNNLQNPDDKRNILPDENLKRILQYDNKVPLTYYTLQKLIQPHFLKVVPVKA